MKEFEPLPKRPAVYANIGRFFLRIFWWSRLKWRGVIGWSEWRRSCWCECWVTWRGVRWLVRSNDHWY